MHNCIFSAHCIEKMCDKSCPILAETSYLLERNGLSVKSKSFRTSPEGLSIAKGAEMITASEGKLLSYISKDTVSASEFLTYCAICMNWQGSRLHCDVYNLRYSDFVNLTKQSWNGKLDTDELDYMRIWIENSKVLIISNIDYVSFGDFECQTLLTLIQNRQAAGNSTIIVSPPTRQLVGKSSFFARLVKVIEDSRGGDR